MPKLMVTLLGFSSRMWLLKRLAPPLAVSPPMPAFRKKKSAPGKRLDQVNLNGIAVLVLFCDAVTKENNSVLGLEEEILGGFRGLNENKITLKVVLGRRMVFS